MEVLVGGHLWESCKDKLPPGHISHGFVCLGLEGFCCRVCDTGALENDTLSFVLTHPLHKSFAGICG